MFTKPLLLAVLAACGVHPNTEASRSPTSEPDKEPPDEIEEKGYIFCCHDVDPAKQTGEGCVTIGEKQIDSCGTVLTCDNFTKEDGTVTCT
jgi:hypothetical protein